MARLETGLNTSFNYMEESDEAYLYEENTVNSLKLKNLIDEDAYNSARFGDDHKYISSKKRRDKKKKKKAGEEIRKIVNRKVVNLPASQPYIKLVDGEERMCFKYNTKVSESALSTMPKIELEENEFCVRFDLDSVDISKLNEKFKADNCVYPRANIPYEMYTGNRWNYETECNRLAWQFVSLNPVLLYGKKGLIQRAVDSFRNISKTSKGQKFYKEETFYGDIEKRKHLSPAVSSVLISWSSRGTTKKCKVQVGVDNIDYSKISDEFKAKYSVLDDKFDENSFGLERWESKNEDNELAVKIAFLNVENTSFLNAIKAVGVHTVLKRAVGAYKHKKDELLAMSEDAEAQDVVTSALDYAFNSVNLSDKEEN
ncbi:uncharacterized protein VICG_02005 [Vittaforma corneae ATCC 50505]|uniref:DUF8032 domain-containing protein n=1 Tax=Vittaforma corneae (strain ATCC 50505) TaxID=993615 RepID=L2GKD6_VITCO|nr:uncharacterized protein VICG_02005 [Vittaforma corneae ATCC 50505]ELA40975.1 hypothetical protein VICG_02005 [Vittaforma corneae ATCC 50505]